MGHEEGELGFEGKVLKSSVLDIVKYLGITVEILRKR